MWKSISLTAPARPPGPTYGVEALALVPIFKTREDFKAFTGVQAPPYDPTRPIKRWYTTDPGTSFMTYNTVPPVPEYISIMVLDAGGVNIPGAFVYPPYDPGPATSGAYFMLNGNKQYLPISTLARWEDGNRIAQELRDAGWSIAEVAPLDRAGMFAVGYEPNESRRILNIKANGENYNVAGLVADQYYDGVGAPGFWKAPSPAGVDWIPAPQQTRTGKTETTEVPVPMRMLEADEKWLRLPMGLQILNTSDAAGAEEVNEQNQAANVAETLRLVRKLSSMLGA